MFITGSSSNLSSSFISLKELNKYNDTPDEEPIVITKIDNSFFKPELEENTRYKILEKYKKESYIKFNGSKRKQYD